MWQHSCSFSPGRQVSSAATEVYFISSALSHVICHPAAFSPLTGLSLQNFPPPTIPLTSCPLTPSAHPLRVFISPSLTLISSSSVFSPPLTPLITILSKMLPPPPQYYPFSLLLQQALGEERADCWCLATHNPRPQKPSSKTASPQKILL